MYPSAHSSTVPPVLSPLPSPSPFLDLDILDRIPTLMELLSQLKSRAPNLETLKMFSNEIQSSNLKIPVDFVENPVRRVNSVNTPSSAAKLKATMDTLNLNNKDSMQGFSMQIDSPVVNIVNRVNSVTSPKTNAGFKNAGFKANSNPEIPVNETIVLRYIQSSSYDVNGACCVQPPREFLEKARLKWDTSCIGFFLLEQGYDFNTSRKKLCSYGHGLACRNCSLILRDL